MSKEKYTILSPEMGEVQTEIYRKIFHLSGYNIKILKATNKSVHIGKKYVNNDACYPSIIIIGVLIEELLRVNYHKNKVAVIISQTEGICRGSNYIALLKIALKKIGYEDIPIIPLGFFNYEKSKIFKMTNTLLIKCAMGTVISDLINKLYLKTVTYEVNKGQAKELRDKYIKDCDYIFKHINIFKFKEFVIKVIREFNGIPVNITQKAKVGIVGEVYLKYNSFGNCNLVQVLQKYDMEVILPDMYAFIQFMFTHTSVYFKYFGQYRFISIFHKLELKVIKLFAKIVITELNKYNKYYIPYDIEKLQLKVTEVVSDCNTAGEGWYLPAKILEFCEKGVNNIICVQPFGCLPNHILGRGTARKIKTIGYDLNFLAIDYDPDISKNNIENRISLFASIAKNNL